MTDWKARSVGMNTLSIHLVINSAMSNKFSSQWIEYNLNAHKDNSDTSLSTKVRNFGLGQSYLCCHLNISTDSGIIE